jgi:hypothetical protein
MTGVGWPKDIVGGFRTIVYFRFMWIYLHDGG